MKQTATWHHRIGALLLAVLLLMPAAPVYAQTPPTGDVLGGVTDTPTDGPGNGTDQCTDIAGNKEKAFGGGGGVYSEDNDKGLLSEIYLYIKEIIGTSTQRLFQAFTDSSAYRGAVAAAITLSVTFFGVAFLIGIVQASFGQVLIRLVKIGIIITLISPGGWQFFSDTVVKFFNDGTDDLVKGVLQIGTGVESLPADATPFYQLDRIAEFVIQPDTIIAIMGAMFAGGPFGLAMGGMLIIAFGAFLKLLVAALRTYAVAFVARSLLLGLAPIFFVFMLFDKTKSMFTSWLNALLSLSLQPILLFTFLSFFLVLIESATKDMLNFELCWGEFQYVEGSQNKVAFWRFVNKDTKQIIKSDLGWNGSVECILRGSQADGKECEEFPINIVDLLCFLILVYLAQRFADVTDRIAYELSNAFISLDAGGRLDQFLQSQTGKSNGILGFGGTPRPPAARPPAATSTAPPPGTRGTPGG